MEVSDVLAKAYSAVESADLPLELREIAFSKAVDLIAATAQPQVATNPSRPGPHSPAMNSSEDLLAKIAGAHRLDRDIIEEIYAEDDGSLVLVVPAAKLERTNAAATKQLALLWVSGQQTSNSREWTSQNTVREQVRNYGKIDSGNFATTISDMDDVLLIKGQGQKRQLKANKVGLDQARDLVLQLANRS